MADVIRLQPRPGRPHLIHLADLITQLAHDLDTDSTTDTKE